MWRRPVRPLIALVLLGAICFGVAAIFQDDDHGVAGVLGAIGWFGFLLCTLGVILLLVAWGVMWATGRARSEPPIA
jgi:uncharacterized membrane protein YbhN (UPF0104 family)